MPEPCRHIALTQFQGVLFRMIAQIPSCEHHRKTHQRIRRCLKAQNLTLQRHSTESYDYTK